LNLKPIIQNQRPEPVTLLLPCRPEWAVSDLDILREADVFHQRHRGFEGFFDLSHKTVIENDLGRLAAHQEKTFTLDVLDVFVVGIESARREISILSPEFPTNPRKTSIVIY